MDRPSDNKELPVNDLTDAFDTFNSSVSKLGANYQQLKENIEALNLEMDEKHRQLEKDFYEANQLRWFFDSILNSMTDGMLVVDSEGRIVLFNTGAQNLTGFNGQEVLGEFYSDVFARGFSHRFSPLYTLEAGQGLNLEEKQFPTKSGDPIPVRYSTSLVKNDSGKVLGALEIFSDLTRIKRLEKEMLQIHTQAALNQMAALVAHEVRNPLGGIRGYVDLIAESFDADDPRREMVAHVTESIVRIDEIVANFNHYTRPVKPYFEATDVVGYLRDVLGYFGQQEEMAEAGLTFVHNLDEMVEPVVVTMDPILIEQCLMSVLSNAVKASENGQQISVTLDGYYSGGGSKPDRVAIAVADEGVGMTADVLDKLFTPFFTTREQGLGLGLALARNFISLHHGDIKVESEPGAGTCVTLILPKQ